MIPVVDLFAGAGGLTEGFASLVDADGLPVFQPVMSVEKDPDACETLRLRAFLRSHGYRGSTSSFYAIAIRERLIV